MNLHTNLDLTGFLLFQLLFAGSFPAFGLGLGCCFRDFCSFSYFFSAFSGFWAGFGVLFWGFLLFQLLFLGFFPAFWLGLGAVLGIFAVSATFSRIFSGFWAGFGSCFRDFCSFSYFL